MKCNSWTKKNCKRTKNFDNANGASIIKFNVISEYFERWVFKKNQYYTNDTRGVRFRIIDCMSNCGVYKTDCKEIDGTAILLVKKCVSRFNSPKYRNLSFEFIFNDLDDEKINCLECNINELIKETKIYFKIQFKFYNLDKNVFIDSRVKELNFTNYSTLCIYDPYSVDFQWEYFGDLFNLPNTDLLITHLFPTDTKRTLGLDKLSEDKSRKLAGAYGTSFEMLKNEYSKLSTSFERTNYLRDSFKRMISNYTTYYYSYAPVINTEHNNVHLYDIICVSISDVATDLLKCIAFKQTKVKSTEKTVKKGVYQQSIYLDDETDNTKMSEYSIRYIDKSVVDMFKNEFQGSKISEKDFKKKLRSHELLPSEGILNIVGKSYKYKTDTIDDNGKKTKYYIFP